MCSNCVMEFYHVAPIIHTHTHIQHYTHISASLHGTSDGPGLQILLSLGEMTQHTEK